MNPSTEEGRAALLCDVNCRLAGLRCLAPMTREACSAIAIAGARADQLQAYLAELQFVQRHIGVVTRADFKALCRDLENAPHPFDFASRLGVDPRLVLAGNWGAMARAFYNRPAECLYCLANFYAFWWLVNHDPPASAEERTERNHIRVHTAMYLVQSLIAVGHVTDGWRAFRDRLGLTERDMADPESLAAWFAGDPLGDQPRLLRLQVASTLSGYLQTDGWHHQLITLWLVVLQLTEEVTTLEALAAKLPWNVEGFPLSAICHNMASLAASLDATGQAHLSFLVLAAALRFGPADTLDVDTILDRVCETIHDDPEFDPGWFLSIFARTFTNRGMAEDGLALLEGWYFPDGVDYQNRTELAAQLSGPRFASSSPAFQLQQGAVHTAVHVLVYALVELRQFADCLAVQEAYAFPNGFDPSRVGEAGRVDEGPLACVEANNRLAYLSGMVGLLEQEGRRADAVSLVQAMTGTFGWLSEGGADEVSAVAGCAAVDTWLRFCGRLDCQRTMEVLRLFLGSLRRHMAWGGAASPDRVLQFQGGDRVALRQRIVDTAMHWVAQGGEAVESLWQLALCVDAELGQRLVFERLLVANQIRVVAAGGTAATSGQWPLTETRPTFPGHLPPGPEAAFAADAGPLECVAAVTEIPPAWQPERIAGSFQQDDVERLIQQGVSAERFARALGGPDTLLIRATFTDDGRLLWAALRSGDGNHLETVTHNAGRGKPYDRDRLRLASARHDLRIRLGWLARRRPDVLPQIPDILTDTLQQICVALGSGVEGRELSRLAAAWRVQCAGVSEGLNLPELGQCLACNYATMLEGSAQVCGDSAWAELMADGWEELGDLIQSLRDPHAPASGESFMAHLDEHITGAYLKSIRAVWDLSALEQHLDPAKTDMVFQVDDVLHSTPLAHLLVGKRGPLFGAVRSVRSTLTVLLDCLQLRSERDDDGQRKRGVLTVSAFDASDPARRGAELLHHGHANLAQQHDLPWAGLGDTPTATLPNLSATLKQHGPFRVVALNAHGHLSEGGVRLADGSLRCGLLGGLGCTDLLEVLSCWVGRLDQSGGLDVEGLVVELAAAGCRSVLACRFPVHSGEAVMFGNEVTARYLQLRAQAGSPEVCGPLRARAVNEARQHFLRANQRTGDRLVGLNTIAACELIGQG